PRRREESGTIKQPAAIGGSDSGSDTVPPTISYLRFGTPLNSMPRSDGRRHDELRPITIQRGFTKVAAGSVLIAAGRTTILCTASVDESVPPWKMRQENPTGWVTAEYAMLPGSTAPRKRREKDGRG